MVKLDLKDRKLLYYLSEDARVSHTALSKKIKLSKNSVGYRVDRLLKEKIIKNFTSVVNLKTLGFTTVTVLLKLNEDIYENKDIFNYLKKHKFIDWMVTLSGNWDVFCEFAVRDFEHLSNILDNLVDRLDDVFNDYKILFSTDTLRVEHLIEDFYKRIITKPLPSKLRSKEFVKIDDVDKKILRLLCEDSSLSYLAIAEKLGFTFDVVRYRIKNLIEKGIIVKFFPEIDLSKLGYTEYLYTIKLKNASLNQIDKIKNLLKNNSNITYAFNDSFGFNLVFTCAFKSPLEVDQLLRELRKKFGDIIESQEYLIIREQVMFNLFPKGLLG